MLDDDSDGIDIEEMRMREEALAAMIEASYADESIRERRCRIIH